jgi:hypothetical protein
MRVYRIRDIVLLLFVGGCFTPPPGANLGSRSPVKDPMSQRAWLAPVEISDTSVDNRSDVAEQLTTSIREYAREGRYFSDVLRLPGNIVGEDLVLRFRFDRYYLKRSAHPAYFPAAFLTATLYIWAGGPIFRQTTALAGSLAVEDATGHVIAHATAMNREVHNVSFWSPEYALPGSVEARTRFVEELLDEVRATLRQRGG